MTAKAILPLLLLALPPGTGAAAAHPATEAAALVLPWGDAVLALAQGLTALLTPVLVAALAAVLARIGGPLRLLVTDALVERLVHRATDYALNAVSGAVRGRTLTVAVGSAVIARVARPNNNVIFLFSALQCGHNCRPPRNLQEKLPNFSILIYKFKISSRSTSGSFFQFTLFPVY